MWFPFQRGGVNFSNQRGVTPPLTPKKFRLRQLLFLTVHFFSKFHALNGIVSPPQAKIFINDIIKVQNQVIGMILQITILKVLPKEGVPLVSFPLFNHFLRLSIRLGYNEVCTLRCL